MDLAERIKRAGKVMVIGNGGSWANSEHLSCDLLNCGITAFTMNTPQFSAFSNDFGYYTAFEKWVGICGRPGDLLIALSGSGKSPNILKACEAAEKIGMDVYKLFGAELGQSMQVSEEHQLRVGHELLRALRK